MNDVLGKPLRLGDLEAKLQAISNEISAMPLKMLVCPDVLVSLGQPMSTDRAVPPKIEPPVSPPPKQDWEEAWKALMQVTLNNRPLAIELLQIAVHENQARSLNLQTAQAEKDYETLRAIAHQIRGSHGNLGLSVLTSLAADLENATTCRSVLTDPIMFSTDDPDRQAAEINRILAAMTIAIQELETFVTEKFPGAKVVD